MSFYLLLKNRRREIKIELSNESHFLDTLLLLIAKYIKELQTTETITNLFETDRMILIVFIYFSYYCAFSLVYGRGI